MKTKLEDHIHRYWKLLDKCQGFSITFLDYLAQSFLETQKNILTGASRFFDQSGVKFGLQKNNKLLRSYFTIKLHSKSAKFGLKLWSEWKV